jgi:signal transduction histidine kinase
VIFKALWLGDELVLARRVPQPGGQVVQGVWLNWPNLRNSLLGSIRDLFPRGDLRRAPDPANPSSARRLAALPLELVTGPDAAPADNGWSPLQISLSAAWAGVILAALAAGVLLHGTLSLSERRATFVSAVTHELRTPLTTFKMYSEMLAEDMVTDPVKRKTYLATLCSEATRLNHLVENVLAYARLERGSARQRIERIPLGELIERVQPRLLQRADQAGMKLVVEADPTAAQCAVQVDVSVVEQILFNLVDNACKYAASGGGAKLVHLEAAPATGNSRFAMLRVRDHGEGISPEAARRLFQPFSKSASEAAGTAPGVGLGLALCHRLSRSLGGELRWDATFRDGACFVLALPVRAG